MEQPVLLWHVTPARFVSRILMEGLMPSRWAAAATTPRNRARISVCTDSFSVLGVARRFMAQPGTERYALLELAIPRGWLHVDPADGEAMIGRRVMPELIRILVPDLDAWDGNYPELFAPAEWRRTPVRRFPMAAERPPQAAIGMRLRSAASSAALDDRVQRYKTI